MNGLHTSHLEISRSAFEENLQFLKKITEDNVIFSSVVKGNAYGHGIDMFVPLAEECGVNHFSVFCANEAYRVREVTNGSVTIMVMGMLDDYQLEWAIQHDIEFYVFDLDRLQQAIRFAKKLGKVAKIHVEVETGMNRTGFLLSELPEVVRLIESNAEHLSFRGLCTHYAGAESIANYYRVKKQKWVYQQVYKKITAHGLRPDLRHTACSAAALRYPSTQMDMVRIGILQYGFFPSKEVVVDYVTKNNIEEEVLQRLISWKSTIMDIKTVKQGEFVGYGTSYLANCDMKIALVPVGYSHGFSRSLSNKGRVLIRGARVSVVGMVNMNMMSVDITNVEGAQKGDEVVLIGRQGGLEITVSSFGEFSTQVNYELLTRLPCDLPRIVVK